MSSAVTRTLANRASLIHQAIWEPQQIRACTVFARFINLGNVEPPKGALKESAKVASQAWASAQIDSAILEAAANPPQGKLAIQKLLSKLKSGVSSAGKTANIKKLIYRSKQRGWLELDLLIGMWAESHLPHLSDTQLNAYSQFLDEENPDLFKWLTGQLPPPSHMSANPAFMMLSTHVQQQLEEYQAPQTAAVKGKDWVRGWDDYKERNGK